MTTDFQAPPKPFAFTTVHTNNGDLTLPCEPINEWLAITPVVGMNREGDSLLMGGFTVTHRPTGSALTEGMGCIECCRGAARALAATGIDWSVLTLENSFEFSASWSAEDRVAVAVARAVEWRCDAEACEPQDDEPPKMPASLVEQARRGTGESS